MLCVKKGTNYFNTFEGFHNVFCAQVYFLSEKNKRTGFNKRTGLKICQKLINEQDLIRGDRTEFFQKINKRTCSSIKYSRVLDGSHVQCAITYEY